MLLLGRSTERLQASPGKNSFGLSSAMRRAAVSVPSNIVEGCARSTESDYIRFLDIAYGSLRDLDYQISLAHRLGYIEGDGHEIQRASCEEACKVLAGLIRSFQS